MSVFECGIEEGKSGKFGTLSLFLNFAIEDACDHLRFGRKQVFITDAAKSIGITEGLVLVVADKIKELGLDPVYVKGVAFGAWLKS